MKLPGYDAWLEAPYQRMCAEEERFERFAELYEASSEYESDLAAWLTENADGERADYHESDEFADRVRQMMHDHDE